HKQRGVGRVVSLPAEIEKCRRYALDLESGIVVPREPRTVIADACVLLLVEFEHPSEDIGIRSEVRFPATISCASLRGSFISSASRSVKIGRASCRERRGD